MKWEKRGHELIFCAERLKNIQSVYIYGAGTVGLALSETLTNHLKIRVEGFIDRKPEKQGTLLNDIHIFPPQKLSGLQGKSTVLIAAGWTKDISQALKEYGFQFNFDFFNGDDFVAMYMSDLGGGRIYLPFVGVMITEFCTLCCEKCFALIPFYQKPLNRRIEQIMDDIDSFFHYVDYVSCFAISGGDAMVHPQCGEILEMIAGKYLGSKIGRIELCTNAVILPDEHILRLLKQFHVVFRVTDYGAKKQNLEYVVSLLKQNDILYDLVHFDYWLDSGFPQESNHIKVEGEQSLADFFTRCDRRTCELLHDMRYYKCGIAHYADRAGWCKAETDDFFDISLLPTPERKKEFLEFSMGFSKNGYYAICRKCNGSFNVNKRKIPVGIQLGEKI